MRFHIGDRKMECRRGKINNMSLRRFPLSVEEKGKSLPMGRRDRSSHRICTRRFGEIVPR